VETLKTVENILLFHLCDGGYYTDKIWLRKYLIMAISKPLLYLICLMSHTINPESQETYFR
jgi:hypothetical protein